MKLLFAYLLLALSVSFLCSLAEACVLSLRRTAVSLLVKQGRRSGRLLDAMKKNIDRPLAAILTLNTIANTIGAAGVGAQAFKVFGDEWVAVVSGMLTLLILVFSEIIPKTLGAVHAQRLAPLIAYLVQGMIIVTYPFVVAFQVLSGALSGRRKGHVLSREEMALIVELGQEHGALTDKELHVIRNLLRLADVRVHAIMTPRTVVTMFHEDTTVGEVVEQCGTSPFSRVPIHANGPDELTGVVLRQQVFELHRAGEDDRRLVEIARPLHAVPEMASVANVLNEFVRRREHIFQVVDEYGGTAGVVTLEDAVESLLGAEIMDETDSVEDMRELGAQLLQRKMRHRRS